MRPRGDFKAFVPWRSVDSAESVTDDREPAHSIEYLRGNTLSTRRDRLAFYTKEKKLIEVCSSPTRA